MVCNSILTSLPNWILEGLRERQGRKDGFLLVRCHQCRNVKYGRIEYKNGRLSFTAVNSDYPNLGTDKPFEIAAIAAEV